jgi:uncharacterized protein (DUF1778 family)
MVQDTEQPTTRDQAIDNRTCRGAESVWLDRTFFRLEPDAFARFNALLENPPPPSAELRALLYRIPPWE